MQKIKHTVVFITIFPPSISLQVRIHLQMGKGAGGGGGGGREGATARDEYIVHACKYAYAHVHVCEYVHM